MKFFQALVLLIAVAGLSGFQSNDSADAERIQITAKKFNFEPAEITVHKGRPVTLELKSLDTTHGLVVKELNIKQEVKKGNVTQIRFTPEAVGTFTGKCAHFCGVGHGSMKLTIHVVE